MKRPSGKMPHILLTGVSQKQRTLLKLPNMRRERATVQIFPKMLTACQGLISLICTSRKFSYCGILWLVAPEIEMGTYYDFKLRCGASYISYNRRQN